MNTHKEYQDIHFLIKKNEGLFFKKKITHSVRVIKTLSLNSQHSVLTNAYNAAMLKLSKPSPTC